MDWDKLKLFHMVAECKSLTEAADRLGLNQSGVSRHISALEHSLKTTLFHRHARGLVLTEQGEVLFKAAQEMVLKLSQVRYLVHQNEFLGADELRIGISTYIGAGWLLEPMSRLLKRFPRTHCHVEIFSEIILPPEDRYDLIIHLHPCDFPFFQASSLPFLPMKAYAQRDYLMRHGVPLHMKDLKNHHLLSLESTVAIPDVNWLLVVGAGTDGLRSSLMEFQTFSGMACAVEAGLGIASLPAAYGKVLKETVEILPELHKPFMPCFYSVKKDMGDTQICKEIHRFLIQTFENLRDPAYSGY